jgi:hypothetical protein
VRNRERAFLLSGCQRPCKRYTPESGTALIDQIFAAVPLERLHILNVGIAEIVSVLVRKQNGGQLSAAAFSQALVNFGAEILSSTTLHVVEADSVLVVTALPLIEKHSLNATDAIVLRSAINLATDHRARGDTLVVVASDQRLLGAAQAEGLETFNRTARANWSWLVCWARETLCKHPIAIRPHAVRHGHPPPGNLTALDLRKTKANAAGIDRLHQALPRCRIEWDGGVVEAAKK